MDGNQRFAVICFCVEEAVLCRRCERLVCIQEFAEVRQIAKTF